MTTTTGKKETMSETTVSTRAGIGGRPTHKAPHSTSSVLLTRSQVAHELGVSRETVQRWESLGLLPPVLKAPTGSRWARADIERVKAGVMEKKVEK